MINIDVALMRTIVAVADAGSITEAARALNKTQSAVSQAVKRLETELGRPLVRRNGRGLVLTEPGEEFAARAREVIAVHARALSPYARAQVDGTVRIGVPDDYAGLVVTRALRCFLDANPGARLDVRCEPSAVLTPAIESGELELAIVTRPLGATEGTPLRRERAVWAVSRTFNRACHDRLPVALFKPPCLFRDAALAALEAAGIPHDLILQSASVSVLLAAAGSGLAVTCVAESSCGPDLSRLGPNDGLPKLPDAVLVLLRAASTSKAADALASHLKESLAA